jgi:hypothetical protein
VVDRPNGIAKPHVSPVDGRLMSPQQEATLNRAFAGCFADGAGEVVITYLRQITINTVLPPTAPEAQLRHHEGMRDLVRIMLTRMDIGKHAAAKANRPAPAPGEDDPGAVPFRVSVSQRGR